MSARIIVVLSDRRDLPETRVQIVEADQYLSTGSAFPPETTVVNLCRSYRYRSKGYYVSLIADARGHRVLPPVEALEELGDPYGLYRILREAGVPTLDSTELKGWRPPVGDSEGTAETMVVFGRPEDVRFTRAAEAAFRAWQIPILRLHFVRRLEEWWVASAEPVPLQKLKSKERERLVHALENNHQAAIGGRTPPPETKRASIAVLFDADDQFAPSTPETIEHLERIAAENNVFVHCLGMDDLERLAEFDALFIRALTGVREPSFQFALRAEMLDMPVIDDPQSIIRCSNKVFLDELLRREGIPTPQTLIVTPRTPWRELETLGTPLVLKLPDGSFSAAVHKVATEREYSDRAAEMFRRSPLLIAQEFVRTEFDWRVAVLDGKVLFVARYFMAEGHWQIRSEDQQGERYGRVEAVRRESAPAAVVDLAKRAAGLIGRGLYGVDIKNGPAGPVVIEINENPNLDRGEDDTADGDAIYREIVAYFVRRIEDRSREPENVSQARSGSRRRRHHRPFSVAGMELEYAVVGEDLVPLSIVEDAFRWIAGRPVSDIDFGGVAFSNEIADHVFEVKTPHPTRSLARAEVLLTQGIRRFSDVLRQEFGARLLPTAMHPWLDPRTARLWKRSGSRIYNAYDRVFDVHTHGWVNVQAAHLNLPMGRSAEAVALHNATALLLPYLPALAASSPMYDGVLHDSVDSRLEWIFRHQARIPESQGDILPEYISSISDYRRRILRPMYRAVAAIPGGEPLKHEFLNARGAVLKFGRRAVEIRVIDMQECVKLDVAVAVFTRSVLRYFTQRILKGRMEMPPHTVLLEDFRETIRSGSRARVFAPHLATASGREEDGRIPVRECLDSLLSVAARYIRRDESEYLPLIEAMIRTGTLAERIRDALAVHVGDPARLREAAHTLYGELADCLVQNQPWRGRGFVESTLPGEVAGEAPWTGELDPPMGDPPIAVGKTRKGAA